MNSEQWLAGDSPPDDRKTITPDDEPRPRTDIRRILVVEDEVFVRLHLEMQVLDAGYELVGAVDNAQAAIDLAEKERPDLILMDVRISGPVDGIDAAIAIWDRLRIRCLFVSGNVESQNRLRARAAHPWGFLAKPFTDEEFALALKGGCLEH